MIDCYEIVSRIINDASEDTFRGIRKNKSVLRSVKTLCTDVNALCERFNASAVDSEVDTETGNVTLTMYCRYIDLYGVALPVRFVSAAMLASYVRMSQASEDGLRGNIAISFIVPGIWEIET